MPTTRLGGIPWQVIRDLRETICQELIARGMRRGHGKFNTVVEQKLNRRIWQPKHQVAR